MRKINLENGKYTVVYDVTDSFPVEVLRYGEHWRDVTGDKFIQALCETLCVVHKSENDDENHCTLKHNGCGEWECTKCGYIYTDDYDQIADDEGLVLWHYCPECGRKIGGGIRR